MIAPHEAMMWWAMPTMIAPQLAISTVRLNPEAMSEHVNNVTCDTLRIASTMNTSMRHMAQLTCRD